MSQCHTPGGDTCTEPVLEGMAARWSLCGTHRSEWQPGLVSCEVCRGRWHLWLDQQMKVGGAEPPGYVGFALHESTEFSELEGTHREHRVQLLALDRTSPNIFSSGLYPPHTVGAGASHKMPGMCLLLSLGRCGCHPSVQCAHLLKHLVTLRPCK